MKKSKQKAKLAYTMPIVLVFMVISQLIYWGILRINHLQSAQNISFQNYYLAQIHYLMLDDYLKVDDDVNRTIISETTMTQIDLIHQEMLQSYSIINEWPLNAQFGIKQIETNEPYERYWLFYTELFLDSVGLEYCPIISDLYCFGQLNDDATYQYLSDEELNLNKSDWLEAYALIENDLLDQGFRPVLQRNRNRQFEWTQWIPESSVYQSDWMDISFQTSNQQIIYQVSTLNQLFQTKFSQPIIKGKNLIRYTGQLFEKEND
ncbi:hypothetical protein [Fundicoccus culcitae]|uniref:Uncharacterized protein n=1 Tax=Fundicoccus culcitae TaxID=2969821 RepID=A0ABY5P656_9LACT|nr:hypothetical protein [Fundicoccus culcitae]UUX34226.1 hypothetical protein NRE15_00730 [Fundicoccus culcitae]